MAPEVPYWQRRISWTFMFESAVRDTYIEAFQAYGYCIQLQNPGSYFGNGGNYVDVAVISIFNVVVGQALYSGQFNLDAEEELFALLVFVRWFQMLFALRAFKLGMIGVKGIIPILHSVKKIGGMGIICNSAASKEHSHIGCSGGAVECRHWKWVRWAFKCYLEDNQKRWLCFCRILACLHDPGQRSGRHPGFT